MEIYQSPKINGPSHDPVEVMIACVYKDDYDQYSLSRDMTCKEWWSRVDQMFLNRKQLYFLSNEERPGKNIHGRLRGSEIDGDPVALKDIVCPAKEPVWSKEHQPTGDIIVCPRFLVKEADGSYVVDNLEPVIFRAGDQRGKMVVELGTNEVQGTFSHYCEKR